MPGGRSGADERHCIDARVGKQRVDCGGVAMDEVERAGRKARLADQSGEQRGGERDPLGRLQDERVAADEGERRHPERDHHGEVERRDPHDHPERLPEQGRIDARADVLEKGPLHRRRSGGGELDRLDPPAYRAAGLVSGLAILPDHAADELVEMGLEQLAEREDSTGAVCDGDVPPVGKCVARRGHRAIHVRGSGPGNSGEECPRRGVGDVQELHASSRDPRTPHEVFEHHLARHPRPLEPWLRREGY